MSVEIREGTVSDDQLCGTIMSAALKREDIPRLFLKNNAFLFILFRKFFLDMISSTLFATEHAKGLPPKVDP